MAFALWLGMGLAFAVTLHRFTPFAVSIDVAIGLNISILFLYAWDKYRAVCNKGRVSEKNLHLCALCTASPGAFIAQRIFRHKISKKPFMRVFYGIVVFQIAVIAIWIRYREELGFLHDTVLSYFKQG